MARFGVESKRMWMALVIVYLVWGSTYLAIRVADETIPPFAMAAARFLIAGSILFAFSARRGDRRGDPIGWPQWRAAALIGGLLLLVGNGGVVWAEQRVASSVTALIVALVPIWMALIAAYRKAERVPFRVVLALAVGFGGTALLVKAAGSGGGAVSAAGVAVLCGAVIAWALGSVLSRTAELPRRPLVATAMEMLCGGAMLAVLAAATGELGHVHPSRISGSSLAGFLYLIAFGSLVAFSAYVWLLQNASTSLVSTYAYVNPVVAVLLGWAILGERVTGWMLLAGTLIVSAVALIVMAEGSRRRPGEVVEPAAPEAARGSPANAPA